MGIEPNLASGFRDYLPSEGVVREKMFATIKGVFERFGFQPLDTPSIEREEVLTGGDPTFNKQLFRIVDGEGNAKELALRFDLTVPLARVIAAYPDVLQKPFKRYQIGKVWRGEKPQHGRFREFVQFDADTVGASSVLADAEIIALIHETLTALGLKSIIRVNNRKILNGLAPYAGFAEAQTPDVLRVLDKLDKISWEGVYHELTLQPQHESEAKSVGLTKLQADAIKQFLDVRAQGHASVLDAVEGLMGNAPSALEGIRELREVMECVDAFGVPRTAWTIDLSVARGLGYYTGPVFEAILTDLPSIGSVFSGGRYDGLVSRFGSATIPATGASVGVDRIYAAMEKLKLVEKEESSTKVLVLNFDDAARIRCVAVTTLLRNATIPTDLYMGHEKTMKGQIVYGAKQNVPVVIILGSEELANDSVVVKDMRNRSQEQVAFKNVVAHVKKLL